MSLDDLDCCSLTWGASENGVKLLFADSPCAGEWEYLLQGITLLHAYKCGVGGRERMLGGIWTGVPLSVLLDAGQEISCAKVFPCVSASVLGGKRAQCGDDLHSPLCLQIHRGKFLCFLCPVSSSPWTLCLQKSLCTLLFLWVWEGEKSLCKVWLRREEQGFPCSARPQAGSTLLLYCGRHLLLSFMPLIHLPCGATKGKDKWDTRRCLFPALCCGNSRGPSGILGQ